MMSARNRENQRQTKRRKEGRGGQQFFLHHAIADHFPARKKVESTGESEKTTKSKRTSWCIRRL